MGNNCITQTKNNWETEWCGFLQICLLCDLIEDSWVLIYFCIQSIVLCGFVGILGLTQICSWKRVVPY